MTAYRDVLLHVGHGKTGSTYIQLFLALNAPRLLELGILYPDSDATRAALAGEITGGNYKARPILDNIGRFARQPPETARLLFSSEALMREIPKTEAFFPTLRSHGLRASVLMFTRDPIEFLRAQYIQQVKRGGFTGSFDDYVKDASPVERHIQALERFLRLCRDEEVPVRARSYDRHSHDLIGALLSFLDIPRDGFEEPAITSNRSLSYSEIVLQRKFNYHLGVASSHFVSDALCSELPDVAPSRLLPSADNLARCIEVYNRHVEKLNALLPAGSDRYRAIAPDHAMQERREKPITFSEEQLDVLARALSSQIDSAEAEPSRGLRARLGAFLARKRGRG